MPRVSELTELPPETKPQRGINWDEIADGRIWELVQGEDFKGKPDGVEARMRTKARAMGRIETRVPPQARNKPPVILVQFSAPGADSNGNGAANGNGNGNGAEPSWK